MNKSDIPARVPDDESQFADIDTILVDETQGIEPEQPLSQSVAAQAEAHLLRQQIKRFTLKKLLGKGGSGMVFLAHDTQLQRDVAIKMLTLGKSAMNKKLLAEARVQAGIEHPNICKIYQVEEADSDNTNSYLVMQYIPGRSAQQWLKDLQGPVNPEQTVTLMQKVCDGLQAMHAQGIIHRDIKPANIMFANESNGQLHPYMVDFGLADINEDANQDIDKTAIAGTPQFMSPEQWQGVTVDRTTDVYSFGATLYHLLTGTPPQSVQASKRLGGKQWQNLPIDLKAIIRKCMHRDKNRRYRSARQVNEDLLRYLNGDPVHSLPGKAYWLRKKLLKHKWPALLAFVLGIGGTTQLMWQQYQHNQQQSREQLLTSFTSRVESLEAKVQLSRTIASHNISLETTRWRGQITSLQSEINRLGVIAYGPGHYAIGRMYIALQQYDQALVNLQQAWEADFQQPRVAYNLALSHGAIYQRQKAIINNIPSKSGREDRMAKLDKQHRQPAITYLEQGMSGSPYQSYTKALLQHYEGHADKALATLERSNDLPAWFYQHHVLRGDIYLAKLQRASITGDDPQVQSHAEQALEHYQKAAQIGRSDLQVQLKPLDVYLLLLGNSLYSKQRRFINLYQQALGLLDNAIAIAPEHYQAYFNKGELLSKMSFHQNQHSGTPLETRQQSIEQYQYALSLAPTNVDIQLSLGTAYVHKIKLSQERDLPVEQLFTLAMNQFKQIPDKNRDYSYYSKYADLMLKSALHRAGQQSNRADDSEINGYFNSAVDSYRQAIELQPEKVSGYVNLGSVFRRWSMIVDLPQVKQKLQQAIEQYQNAHHLNPKFFATNFYLTQSYGFLADVNTLMLESPEAQLKQGMSYVAATQLSHPEHPYVVLESVNLAIIKAVFDWQNGNLDPDTLAQAKTAISDSLTLNPNNTTVLDGRAYLYRIEQQLAYFSAGAKIDNQQDYQKALSVSKNILSQKHEEYILLALLSGQHQLFTKEDLNTLPVGDHSRLARAQWLSLSGDFEQAEKIFASIQRIYPAILWQYRQLHLSRWVEALEAAPSASTAAKVAYINRSASNLDSLLGQHFPALVR